ncbi:hypothetical protein H6P81_018337 [Aristolochia fimbriata]|uniref:DHHA1 domain-containing protein n=1 Tax=Aristolochia fimbriata TaxID=158543 RepID=A0AAV7E1I8_ARIFI|nr:hypothetical protein H6P81_018337 [Aristolochia fimbriata]
MGALRRSAVLYHYPCPDGAFAALAAHLYFKATSLPVSFFPNTVYDPIRPENLPLDELDDVYLLDFAGPEGFVKDISTKVERVIVLDHHKTAMEMLGGDASFCSNVIKVLDMKRCGATIAFDYFRDLLRQGRTLETNRKVANVDMGGKLVPADELERVTRLYKYIEDGDLWTWAIPDSKAFSSGLKDLNIEFDARQNPSFFDQLLSLDPQHLISQGKATLSHKQKLIDEVLEQSYEIALGGGLFGHCLAVDADSISNLRSELGNQLAQKSRKHKFRGIGAVVYKVPELENDQVLKISLRSMESEDTTPISQEYGGGGHRNASLFTWSWLTLCHVSISIKLMEFGRLLI